MAQSAPASRPVVLVVEDEPVLRMMAVGVVEEVGMEAIEAADADAAIEILEARTDVHILFSDIRMPGSMDGLKLASVVATRWPPVRIILTSGHCSKADIDLAPGNLFFAKPYNFGALQTALRSLTT